DRRRIVGPDQIVGDIASLQLQQHGLSSASAMYRVIRGGELRPRPAAMSRGGQCRERGGELLQQDLRLADNMDDLVAALAAGGQDQIAPRQSPFLGEQGDQRVIGTILGGRRGDRYFQDGRAIGGANDSVDAVGTRPRRQADLETYAVCCRGKRRLTT